MLLCSCEQHEQDCQTQELHCCIIMLECRKQMIIPFQGTHDDVYVKKD